LGYNFDRDGIDKLYQAFLKVADVKKEVGDEDLKALAANNHPEVAIA
jgi:2-isopropylmalate synthase